MSKLLLILFVLFGADRPSVLITEDWLRSRTEPYQLDAPDTNYVLATDVTTNGTAFVVTRENIHLDGGTKTVTYGDREPLTVSNGGFEDGLAGWDVSGAPTAKVLPARLGMWGNSMLSLTRIEAKQVIVSSPVQLKALVQHTATIVPKATDALKATDPTVLMEVIDSEGNVLGSDKSDDSNRGVSCVVTFTPLKLVPVRLRVTVTPHTTTGAAACDLDFADLNESHSYGVVASPSGTSFPSHLRAVASSVRRVKNFTVSNVTLRSGRGRPLRGDAIYAKSLPGLTVSGVKTFVNGIDAEAVHGHYAASVTIRDSVFEFDSLNITDRMKCFGAVYLSNCSGPIVVEGNRILNCPQQGVSLFFNRPESTVRVANNTIRQNARGTNAYGIAICGLHDFLIEGNTVNPESGEGMIVDGFKDADGVAGRTERGVIRANRISAFERGNLEYGNNTDSCALRKRTYAGYQRALLYEGNTFTATTDEQHGTGCLAARISADNASGLMNDANVRFVGNKFIAYVNTDNPKFTAVACSLAGIDPRTNLLFDSNTFISNDKAITLGDKASYRGLCSDVTFSNNRILQKPVPGVTREYTAVVVGHQLNKVANVRFLKNKTESGPVALTIPGPNVLVNVSVP